MAPIKIVMAFGIFLMLLQTVAFFCRDLARVRAARSEWPSAVAITMFASMLVLLLSRERSSPPSASSASSGAPALGTGGQELPFNEAITVMNWYPLLTVPLFIYMATSSRKRHRRRPLPHLPRLVRPDPRRPRHRHHRPHGGDLRRQRLSVAGMAIGATVALPSS